MKKSLKIAIVLVLVISFTIGGIFISRGLAPKEDNSKRIEEIKERLIDAKVEQNQEFRKNGLSKEFYVLQNEIADLNEEKYNLEKQNHTGSNLVHIIAGIFIIIFGCAIAGMIYASTHITKSISSMDFSNINKSFDSVNKNINETIEAVNENIKQQTKRNKKFVAAKCPNCGSALKDADTQVCEYCDQTIIRQ